MMYWLDLEGLGTLELHQVAHLLLTYLDASSEACPIGPPIELGVDLRRRRLLLVDEDQRMAINQAGRLVRWFQCHVCSHEGLACEVFGRGLEEDHCTSCGSFLPGRSG